MAAHLEESPKRARAVFLDDSVEVECSFSDARTRFCSDGGWLAPMATRATDEGEHYLRVGPGGSGRGQMEVSIRLGACSGKGVTSVVPIRWEATRLCKLFPVLDGNVELVPLGEGRCRLGLQASYRPPLDGVGRLLDHALLHKVAVATIGSFLAQVAHSLEGQDQERVS